MRLLRKALSCIAVSALVVAPMVLTTASAGAESDPATPAPPFTECPSVGYNTSCSLLIYVTNSGDQILDDPNATVATDPTPGTYDGADDTLIGILNASSVPLSQISLSSSTDIFGFDGDGICENPNSTSSLAGLPATDCADVNTIDTTTYGGPDSYFTNMNAGDTSGTVNFIKPLAPGSSTYFSLEEALTPADFLPLTTVSTSLTGGGQSGTSISVPSGTAVTDTATLTGTSATMATGTVTYNIYSDATCTSLALTGTAQTITTVGTLPPSPPATLTTPGTYYWQASYSGDSNNSPSSSTCGSSGEVETVTQLVPEPTRLKTLLVGRGRHGLALGGSWRHDTVTVFAGTPLTDTATLTGTNATLATGTVNYTIYRVVRQHRHLQLKWVRNAGTVAVSSGTVPDSNPVKLGAGIYEWQASYSGDKVNEPSKSRLGSETEIVLARPRCQKRERSGWGANGDWRGNRYCGFRMR
jgi:hypothetical protein